MSKLFALIAIALVTSIFIAPTVIAFDGFDHDEILYRADASNSTITVEVNTEKSGKHKSNSSSFTATRAHDATTYKKLAILSGHKMETVIHMWQPQGTGFGGAFPRWTMTIKRDGKTLYDTTFGHNHYLDIDIYKVVIGAKSAKINVTWVAEIDDTSHVSNLVGLGAFINEKTLEQLKQTALKAQ